MGDRLRMTGGLSLVCASTACFVAGTSVETIPLISDFSEVAQSTVRAVMALSFPILAPVGFMVFDS
jgi:hypothetical protein